MVDVPPTLVAPILKCDRMALACVYDYVYTIVESAESREHSCRARAGSFSFVLLELPASQT